MSEPHWNEYDPAADESYPRIEAAAGEDEFPSDWGTDGPTERDQEAIDSGAADEALFQGLIDAGWTPPAAGAHAEPGDADPATAQIDAGPPVQETEYGSAAPDDVDYPVTDVVGYPHWD